MKPWEIVFNKSVEPEVQKKIKRLLRPYRSVGRPQKCLFCSVDTTWTLNNQPVCPKCSVEYKFLSEQWLLDPCEVCGKQGEWATDGDPQHFLCYIHRDEWLKWKNPELGYIDSKKEPGRWIQVWEKGWRTFIILMKEEVSV